MYDSIASIRKANADAGGHFFDRDTVEFFDSQIGRTVFGGRYFLTSERYHSSEGSLPRRWTIRVCHDDGNIETVGEFQQFARPQDAVNAVRRLVDNDTTD